MSKFSEPLERPVISRTMLYSVVLFAIILLTCNICGHSFAHPADGHAHTARLQSKVHSSGMSAEGGHQRPRFAGLVLKARGHWVSVLDGKRRLIHPGDAIPYGARLVPVSKGAYISGFLINKEKFECPGSEHCGKALEPLSPKKGDEKPWWLVGLDWLTAPAGDWIKPIARGGTVWLRDGVVVIENERIDLSSFVTLQGCRLDKPQGFIIRLNRLPSPAHTASQTKTAHSALELHISGDSMSLSAGGITPGAYQFSVFDEDHSETELARCWILIVDKDRHPLRLKYDEAFSSLVDSDLDSSRASQLIRAYLLALAEELERSR